MEQLLISSRNEHKIEEFRQILGGRFEVFGLEVLPNLEAVDETGSTFEENAVLKAMAASHQFRGWVVADDSGLEVDALRGEPGVRSARYAGEGATDGENNMLLLSKLEAFRGKERTARFRCVLALVRDGKFVRCFSGSVEGTIINKSKGCAGFGYDPLFVPKGYCETFAELGAEVKNQLSHRAVAIRELETWLSSHRPA